LDLFIVSKNDAFASFEKFVKILQNQNCINIYSIISDYGGKFQNEKFNMFCEKNGMKHKFSAPRTTQKKME